MNKKLLTLIIAIICVLVVTSGVIVFQTLSSNSKPSVIVTCSNSPGQPTQSYYISENSAHYYYDSYYGWATSIIINTEMSSSKPVILNETDFYVATNGQPLTNICLANFTGTFQLARNLYGASGYDTSMQFNFIVPGNVTSYQLACNGTVNVKIIQIGQ